MCINTGVNLHEIDEIVPISSHDDYDCNDVSKFEKNGRPAITNVRIMKDFRIGNSDVAYLSLPCNVAIALIYNPPLTAVSRDFYYHFLS